jgi:purine-nucleoside phosphorylase
MQPEAAYEYQVNYEKKVAEAVEYLRLSVKEQPEFGIVLGSGLGDIADLIHSATIIDYKNIPNFPVPTVKGHEGKLYIGKLEGINVIGLKGRKHYYEVANEPYDTGILQVVFPVHVLAGLGVKNYFSCNAAGGLNPRYQVGDLMVIRSHVSLIPNPLLGRQRDFTRVDCKPCERFQPMNDAYDPALRDLFKKAAAARKDHVHEGVLLSIPGPSFETEAESMAFRDAFKADATSMSVAPEIVAARNRGMRCIAFSCITNLIDNDGRNPATHGEVLRILESREVKDRLTSTVQNFFRLFHKK